LQFSFKSSGRSVMCSRMIWGKGMLEMEDVPVLEMNGTAYSMRASRCLSMHKCRFSRVIIAVSGSAGHTELSHQELKYVFTTAHGSSRGKSSATNSMTSSLTSTGSSDCLQRPKEANRIFSICGILIFKSRNVAMPTE